MKKEIDEHVIDQSSSAEERARKLLRSNIKKSLRIGLSVAAASGAILLPFVNRVPASTLTTITFVAAPLLLGASTFMLSFCVLTCTTATGERQRAIGESDSGRLSEGVLTRQLEDEMNKTTDFRGYVARIYPGSEETKENLVVFRSRRLTSSNVALKVPGDIVSLLAKLEWLTPYIFTSIQLDRHVKGIMRANMMMYIVAVSLAIGSMLLLPILTGRDFLDAVLEFWGWIFMAWIVVLFVWAAAQTLKYMREERGIDQRAAAEYPEFPTALRMLAASGLSPTHGHPAFAKRLRRLGFNEPEPVETGFNSGID